MGNIFIESDFCDAEKCVFLIDDENILEKKICPNDATIFGNPQAHWQEVVNPRAKSLTLYFGNRYGRIPDFYGSSGMKGCEK